MQQSAVQNRLLSRLSAEDFALFADRLHPLDCARGMTVAEAQDPLPYAYFFETGVASVIATSPEGQKTEAGLIGRDGFVHPALVLGSDRVSCDIDMHLAGRAHRIASPELIDVCERSATLRRKMLQFAYAYQAQTISTTLANAVHQIDERLARWLLMCHDRIDSDDIALTHQYMGTMLSVRRVSVTNALHVLEGNGFIELARGTVVIRNRAALEDFASDAYGAAEAEYRRLLGPL